MTKLNLKRVKDYKSLLSKDTRISISTENEMLRVSTVIGEMQNKDTPLTPEEEGGCGGGWATSSTSYQCGPQQLRPCSWCEVEWDTHQTEVRWPQHQSQQPKADRSWAQLIHEQTKRGGLYPDTVSVIRGVTGWLTQYDVTDISIHTLYSCHRPRLRQRTPKTSSQNTSFPPAKISSLHPSYQLLSVWRGLS